MARHKHPNFLRAVTGTHRRPSTFEVITACCETERLIKRAREAYNGELKNQDRLAIVDWVSASLCVLATYAFRVALSSILLSLLYALLVFGVLAAVNLLVL